MGPLTFVRRSWSTLLLGLALLGACEGSGGSAPADDAIKVGDSVPRGQGEGDSTLQGPFDGAMSDEDSSALESTDGTAPDSLSPCHGPTCSLCRPCSTHADCQSQGGQESRCVPWANGAGSFCGADCGPSDPCPSGYTCETRSFDGAESEQCVPVASECKCDADSIAKSASTPCSAANQEGSCPGARTCTVDGLSPCSAPSPTNETCNGEDDDCDGETDEQLQEACITASGGCPGARNCKGGHWSPCAALDPPVESCDGLDNDCDGATDEGSPDADGDGVANCVDPDRDGDGVDNDQDNCPDLANPTQSDLDGTGGGDACDLDDDGDGYPDMVDCAPADSTIGCYDYYLDGDGDGAAASCAKKTCACAPQGKYTLSSCTPVDCDDADPTVAPGAVEICDGKANGCDGIVDAGFDLGIACDGADADSCANGKTACGPDGSLTCVESGKSIAESCDGVDNDCDGETDEGCQAFFLCNSLVCDGPACVVVPKDCSDGAVCTLDTCFKGECDHTLLPDGASCDDGDACTIGEKCVSGDCLGALKSCDDGLWCTLDSCADSQCAHEVQFACLIGGECISPGTLAPGDTCAACIPSEDKLGFASLSVGAECDDGNSCTVGETCGLAGCGSGPMPPVVLPESTSCDDADPCTTKSACDAAGVCVGPFDKDTDGDTFVDATCPGGDDCDDAESGVKPGAPDPFEGLNATLGFTLSDGYRGLDIATAVDSKGHRHVVWVNVGDLALEYSTDATGQWVTATIPPTHPMNGFGLPHGADIFVDGQDTVHLLSRHAADLQYATNAGGHWTVSVVAEDLYAKPGAAAGMAATPDGVVHVMYKHVSEALLHREIVDGVVGPPETVEAVEGEAAGQQISVAAGPDGSLHALYLLGTGETAKLRYAKRDMGETSWTAETVDTLDSKYCVFKLAVGADGVPNVLYSHTLSKESAIHARRVGTWVKTPLWGNYPDRSYGVGWGLAVRPDSGIEACFFRFNSKDKARLFVLSSKNVPAISLDDYEITEIDDVGEGDMYCDLSLGSDGTASVVWTRPLSSVVSTVTREPDADSFGFVTVMPKFGTVADQPRIAVDSANRARVAYFSKAEKALYLAWQTDGIWFRRLLEGGSVEGYPSIAIDSNDDAHFAYRDLATGGLRYGRLTQEGFEAKTIAVDFAVTTPSIAVASDGTVVIAWKSESTKTLRLTTGTLAGWTTQTLDSNGDVGDMPTLVLDAQDHVHLTYLANTNSLRYLTNKAGGYGAPESPTTALVTADRAPLVVDSDLCAHVLYDPILSNGALIATNKTGTWATKTIKAGTSVDSVGLAADPAGRLFALYRSVTEASKETTVLVATNMNGAWSVHSIDSFKGDLWNGVLAAAPDGSIRLAYYRPPQMALMAVSVVKDNPIDQNCDGE